MTNASHQRTSKFLNYVEVSQRRARIYYVALVGVVLWFAGYLFFLIRILRPSIYWLSYYAANYHAGFVRRGLGGQIIDLFPARYYFPVAYTLMWGSVAVFCGALALVAGHILFSGAKSERRMIVAVLVPVLPFAVTFAISGPRPELFAAAALLAFGTALSRLRSSRGVIVSSALYGLVIAALALIHEVIPIEFALGAVLAISVLAPSATRAIRWCAMLAAIGPGLMSTAAIYLFGRKKLGAQLCEQVPHQNMQDPFGVPSDKVADYVFGRYEHVADYHDWVCENISPYFDASLSAWLKTVMSLGPGVLIAGFLHGLIVCIVTMWLIQHFTGVRWTQFKAAINGGIVLPILALAMVFPIFAIATDWIRWWTVILINMAGVYLIYAAGRPEIEKPVSGRQAKAFLVALVLLTCLPVSAGPSYYAGWVKVQ
ncbi:hypothetical protein BOH72_08220 [Mycobacterium sp. WY10]|nr:hypothetical protein BOH72_08220 [Mycobacterium sp. WY10]